MKTHYLLLLFTIIMLSACQDTPPPAKQEVLPNTPSEVAQVWIEAFYNDDFPKAVKLGTDLTRMMIDSVKKEMEPNAALIAFKISDMSCQTHKDSAFCAYVYKEEQEEYQEYVSLLNVKGQWLVNESWDASSTVEQEFDMIREEVEKLIEEEALEKE